MSGAIEKLISESEVVAHLYAVAGSVGEMIDAARAELAALRAENANLRDEKRDILANYEERFRAMEAENARLAKGKQEEFDIATGYHRRWQKAEAENARYREVLTGIRDMPEIDQDDAHRLRHRAAAALSGAPSGIFLSLDQAKEIEWAGSQAWRVGAEGEEAEFGACPACLRLEPIAEDDQLSYLATMAFREYGDELRSSFGHAPDCWLSAKIKQAEEEQQCPGHS